MLRYKSLQPTTFVIEFNFQSGFYTIHLVISMNKILFQMRKNFKKNIFTDSKNKLLNIFQDRH